MTNQPTRLDDARAAKRLKLPLNTPFEHRHFSPRYTRHWVGLMKAQVNFRIALAKHSGTTSIASWRRVKRKLAELQTAITRCDKFIGTLGSNKEPPIFKTEQDAAEAQILSLFLVERAVPYIDYWHEAIAAVDDGAELCIAPQHVPMWLDK